MANNVMNEFEKISKIPRPSHHEEQICDYLFKWAKEKGIFAKKDEHNNVYMRVPASVGYEDYSSIALQAHTDMVTEKAIGVEHDFMKDPIEFFIDGDIVSTRGRTTLGADNGLGVAIILSLLSDDELDHPKLEAIFTSGEEDDFYGADGFDGEMLESNYLINLDNGNEDAIICASAGGVTVDSIKALEYVSDIGEGYSDYKIELTGLRGGHSGQDIDKGRGNTNILLFRLLNKLIEFDWYALDIIGGSFRLAIPRDSWIKIRIKNNDIEDIKKIIEEFKDNLVDEFPKEEIKLKLVECELDSSKKIIKREVFEDVIDFVLTSPTDVQIMSNQFANLVDSSANLGEIYISENNIVVITDIRASYDSQRAFILDKLLKLNKAYKMENKVYGHYYNWKYKPVSKLRDLVESIYNRNNSNKANVLAVHVGLECGYFDHKKDNMDIVCIGSNSWDYHSPDESFSIKSLNHFYRNLEEILRNAKFSI